MRTRDLYICFPSDPMIKHTWSSPSGLNPGELRELTRGKGVEAGGCQQGSEPQRAFRGQWLGRGWRQVSFCVLFILNLSAHLTRLAQGLGGDIRCPKSQPRDKALPTRTSAQLKLPRSKAQSRFQGHLLYYSRKQGSEGLACYPGLDVG